MVDYYFLIHSNKKFNKFWKVLFGILSISTKIKGKFDKKLMIGEYSIPMKGKNKIQVPVVRLDKTSLVIV